MAEKEETLKKEEKAEPEDVQMHIPDDWQSRSDQQKEIWFLMYYGAYVREGEVQGIRNDAPDDVKAAFEEFRKAPDSPWKDAVESI